MVLALLDLYASTTKHPNGTGWLRDDNWLRGEPCADGWYGVHCCPVGFPVMRLSGGAASDGYACVDIEGNEAPAAALGGAICTRSREAAAAPLSPLTTCVVVAIDLRLNQLHGELPMQWERAGERLHERLPALQLLEVSGNELQGPLPDAFTELGAASRPMQRLSLGGNRFDYGASAAALQRLVQRCKEGGFSCFGLPPVSCTAFVRTEPPIQPRAPGALLAVWHACTTTARVCSPARDWLGHHARRRPSAVPTPYSAESPSPGPRCACAPTCEMYATGPRLHGALA